MMRALLAALALLFAAGACTVYARASLEHPRIVLERAPAASFLVVAKYAASKRCGSRGGVRRTRSTYAAAATCA